MKQISVFSIGFRPLFLVAGWFAVIAILWWSLYWGQFLIPSLTSFFNPWQPYGGAIWWHGHEMLFGFTTAIIGGFLLTAVQNWTGVTTIKGLPLALLTIVWLMGRILLALPGLFAESIIVIIDLAYLPLLALAIAHPIVKAKLWRNLMFVPILFLFWTLNGLSHWAVFTENIQLASQAFYGATLLTALIIMIIGGRVLPFFTVGGLRMIGISTSKVDNLRWLDIAAILPVLMLVIGVSSDLHTELPNVTGWLALTATIFGFLRWWRWQNRHCFKVPLLWSAHLAYAFIPLGLLMIALVQFEILANMNLALHAITLGAIGGMILSIMSRVSLGHTGRMLIPAAIMSIAFAALLIAALIRSLLPLIWPIGYMESLVISGGLWIFSFMVFVIIYTPILITPRPDGKP
jgi:uncharacterized protein involved in response to NO